MALTGVVLEACAGSHHWGRTFGAMGHQMKLIPPQHVKPFVKRSKNDRNDAEAISEAAARPSMRIVPVKTVDEQAAAIIVKHREMLVGQRTQAINALRGHSAEFGIVVAKGCGNVEALLSVLAKDLAIPPAFRKSPETGAFALFRRTPTRKLKLVQGGPQCQKVTIQVSMRRASFSP
jgi:transposase